LPFNFGSTGYLDKSLSISSSVSLLKLIKQAIDRALQYDNDPQYDNEMMKIQAISNYTVRNKLELISKGFITYKIKQHIEYLKEQANRKENKKESTGALLDLNSLSFLFKSDSAGQVNKGISS
jgi:hypothetical protein